MAEDKVPPKSWIQNNQKSGEVPRDSLVDFEIYKAMLKSKTDMLSAFCARRNIPPEACP